MRNFAELEDSALRFALERHKGQTYGYHRSYVLGHLTKVAGKAEQMIDILAHRDVYIAAILHDVLEDTHTERIEVADRFGESVAQIVVAVTGEGKNRQARNAAVYEKILHVGWKAAVVKLADRYCNVRNAKDNIDRRSDVDSGKHILAMYAKEWPEAQACLKEALLGIPSEGSCKIVTTAACLQDIDFMLQGADHA